MNLKEENEELREVLELARSHIVELCTVMNIPLPDATIRRIDSAISKQACPAPAHPAPGLPDYLNDAIENLVHDNYERSQAGSRNRQADADLIRAALATRPAQKVNNVDTPEQQPVAWQHKKPAVNDSGEIVGYSAWTNGKGLDWWPHRPLYAAQHRGK